MLRCKYTHKHLTRFHGIRNAYRTVDVLREHRSGQAIDGVIGHLDQFFLGLELYDNTDGAKDFLADNLHVGFHVCEDSRLHEEARIA